jgi:hypothetical protein
MSQQFLATIDKKFKLFSNIGFMEDHDLQHGFNVANYKLISVLGGEISSDNCQILTVWSG